MSRSKFEADSAARVPSVSMKVGATALTLIPYGPLDCKAAVRWLIAAFVMQ
jgi:hypothetical protein